MSVRFGVVGGLASAVVGRSDLVVAGARPDQTPPHAACAWHIDRVTGEVVTALGDAPIPARPPEGPSIARWLFS